MPKSLKDEIIEQIDLLQAPQQRRVLDFARGLRTPAGTPGHELVRFAGAINPVDLDSMSQAIQEGCEKVRGQELP